MECFQQEECSWLRLLLINKPGIYGFMGMAQGKILCNG